VRHLKSHDVGVALGQVSFQACLRRLTRELKSRNRISLCIVSPRVEMNNLMITFQERAVYIKASLYVQAKSSPDVGCLDCKAAFYRRSARSSWYPTACRDFSEIATPFALRASSRLSYPLPLKQSCSLGFPGGVTR
jgi:hypothetical protein